VIPKARRDLPFWAALLAALLSTGLHTLHAAGWLDVPFFDDAEHDFVDWRFRNRGPVAPAGDRIVIVALDDETRARAPEIFQRRAGWARLIEAVTRGQPRVVAVDAFFSAPEVVLSAPTVAALEKARASLPAELGETAAALEAALDETRGDEKLAKALAGVPRLVLAGLFLLDRDPAGADRTEPPGLRGARFDEAAAAPAPAARRPPLAADYVVLTRPAIAGPSASAGFVNKHADADGVTRRAYLVIERAGRFYAPLGLRAAAVYSGEPLSYLVGDRDVGFGERRLPVDARGQAQLGFLGPRGTFPLVSAADVLEGKVPADRFADKIVFVGYADAARDLATTPFDTTFFGVELHATLAENALEGTLYRGLSPAAILVVVALAALLAALLQVRGLRGRRTWIPILLAALLLAGWVVAAVHLFESARLVLPVVWPGVTLVVVVFTGVSTAVVVEGVEKARIRNAFAQYLDERAVKQLLADPSLLRLGGERRELTALFSDIRGFTAISEKLDPEQVISFLNEYLTPMTEVVWETGGLLDKYIGDAVMAVYGAPLEHGDHAKRACLAALAMQERLEVLNQRWARAGLPKLAIGIGLNTGVMSVGNMGSERRKNYTVVGDAVNLASRLEGLTKAYDVPILCGERTAEQAGDGLVFRELDLVRAKGKDQATRVFALVGPRGSKVPAEWPGALAAYRARDWDASETLLDAILAAEPDDGPARGLKARIAAHRISPPPPEWDGAYDQDTK
jgi:adenylate cyclase